MAADSAYSGARAMKPGGGAGSSIRWSIRPWSAIAFTYRERGRCTNGRFDARRDLLDRHVFDEIRADAPVLLLEDVVVDPAAARHLEQRVVEEKQERPAGLEYPGDLGDRGIDRDDVFEDQARDHGVEGGVAERKSVRRGAQRTAGRRRDRRATRVCASEGSMPTAAVTPALIERAGELALTGPDVEHSTRAPESFGHDRGRSAPRIPGRRRR